MTLSVELYGHVIGSLVGTDPRAFDFVTSDEGLTTFGTNSHVLSAAIPLTGTPTRSQAERRRNFFAELLPEGDQLDHMLTVAGLRRGDTIGFLARYGRDVAGALQIWDPADPREPPTPAAEPVDDSTIRGMLTSPQRFPLGNTGPQGRTSLAGVQPKIVLAWGDHTWCRVSGGHPSTHIVKPWLERFPTVIFDEEYGSRFVRRLGLATYATQVTTFDGLPALVVERFDRDEQGGRIHQEDFNQALGASGVQKYQAHGGVVTLKRMAETLRRVGATQDLPRLAQLVTLANALGNLDMHAKNLGLLHHADGSVRLAPGYDFVPLAHQPVNQHLALAVAGQYAHRVITAEHLVAEFTSWRLPQPARLVSETLEMVLTIAREETPLAGAWGGLQDDVTETARRLLDTGRHA